MKIENSILTVRFVGERLKNQGMPIFELGHAFISIQRIINKAYLAQNQRLAKGKYPERVAREQLFLQIGAHEKRSDFFGLIPILSDPVATQTISSAVSYVLDAVKSYAAEKVIEYVSKEKDENKQIYIGAIHAEMVNIVNRIDNVGGCESIQIGSPSLAPDTVIELTERSRDYIRHVADEPYLGQIQTIKGDVFKMYTNLEMVEIRRPGGKKCKVYLSTDDFDLVRLGQVRSPTIKVTGRPKYRIGQEGRFFDEFEGNSVEIQLGDTV